MICSLATSSQAFDGAFDGYAPSRYRLVGTRIAQVIMEAVVRNFRSTLFGSSRGAVSAQFAHIRVAPPHIAVPVVGSSQPFQLAVAVSESMRPRVRPSRYKREVRSETAQDIRFCATLPIAYARAHYTYPSPHHAHILSSLLRLDLPYHRSSVRECSGARRCR
jgi:hypothetical protein